MEMEAFIENLSKMVDEIECVEFRESEGGYFCRIFGRISVCWLEVELKLFYSKQGEVAGVRYVIIQYFQVAIERCGYGTRLFKRLLQALMSIEHLEMIRLEATDEIGRGFWMKKLGFRLKGETYEKIEGNSCWFDLDCEKKCGELYLYRYIYDVRRCECSSCQGYYKEK